MIDLGLIVVGHNVSWNNKIRRTLWSALILCTLSGQVDATGFEHVMKPGLYEIEVSTEGAVATAPRSLRRCLITEKIAAHQIFEVLTISSVMRCPKYEICAGQYRTGFVAQCQGRRALSAVGMFALEPAEFRGRIEVRNADNALIGAEIQYGRRVGDCTR